ncbi:hypothetical protein L6654_42635, partial [Bradyrhizobium sp. WYCCWR 13023]
LRDNQSSTKLLRATIIAAIIIRPRHCLAILIAAHFLPRLPRYNLANATNYQGIESSAAASQDKRADV